MRNNRHNETDDQHKSVDKQETEREIPSADSAGGGLIMFDG